MSSPKKIGRWKRFEIAFAQETRLPKPLFTTPERLALDKTGGSRKMDKKPSGESAVVEDETTEKEAFPEIASSRQVRFPVSGTPSLWEEARRSKIDAEAQRRVDLALKSEKLKTLEGGKKLEKPPKSAPQRDFPFGKPRRRTFRASDPPRRFDRLRGDQEEDGPN